MTTRPSTDDRATNIPGETSLAWCRDRLLVPGHPLTVTLPYADPGQRERLLALSALVGEIASVPGTVREPDVARRKLDWWRGALAGREPHPAIKAWIASGAESELPASSFEVLIDAVAREIEPPRFEQIPEFGEHARAVAGPAALLEAELVDEGLSPELAGALRKMAGAAYAIRVARDMVVDARHDRWLVPLELQAEYGLTRQEVAAGGGGHRLNGLVRHLVGEALLQLDRAAGSIGSAPAWRHRHLLLKLHLDRRIGRALLRRPARVTRERVPAGGPLAALSVWRRARRMRKAARAG